MIKRQNYEKEHALHTNYPRSYTKQCQLDLENKRILHFSQIEMWGK